MSAVGVGGSSRLEGLARSGIREIMDLTIGRSDVVRLEVGEPDLPTPPHIVAALGRAAEEGHTRYTSGRGTAALRAAVARKVWRVNGVTIDPETDVVITAGAANGLLVTLAVVADPGEAVLVPDPGWPNYVGMVRSLGLRCVRYPMPVGDGFQPDVAAIDALLGASGARVIVINSPHNPTGTIIEPDRLAAIVAVAERHGVTIVSDECYDEIVLDGRPAPSIDPSAVSAPVINVYSLSKTFAMTGWRVGYVTGPTDRIAQVARVQEMWLSCVSAPVQRAAEAALDGDQAPVARFVAAYRERRDRAMALAAEFSLDVHRPGGAFYLMVGVGRGAPVDSMGFARRLLLERGVAVAPGSTFGAESQDMVRLSLAADTTAIEAGLRAIAAAVVA